MMLPRVCVIIPAYNSSAYLDRALYSVQHQTCPAEEIIVVDDGSTDGTVAIARAHGVRVITQENAGPAAARNTGIRAASAEWIAFLDADDTWMEHKLERQFEAISREPRVGLVFSNYLYVHDCGTHQRTGFDLIGEVYHTARSPLGDRIWLCDQKSLGKALIRSMFILTSSVLLRRSALLESKLFDTTMRCAEDYELFLRILMRTQAAVVDEALVAYRRHPESISVDLDLDVRSREQLIERCTASPQNYPAGAATHLATQRMNWIARAAFFALRSGAFCIARKRAIQSLHVRVNALALVV